MHAVLAGARNCDGADTHSLMTSQFDVSINRRVSMQARQASAKAILVRNTGSFNAYECDFVFSVWNRRLEFEDRRTLLSPVACNLEGLVASHFDKADAKLIYETILLCAACEDTNEDFRPVLNLIEGMPKSKRSVFCRVALQFAEVSTGNTDRLREIEQSLEGSNGDLEQLVSLNCARWLPISDWHETADRLLGNPMTPLAAKLLALYLVKDATDQRLHPMDVIIAGIREKQRLGFYLSPYHLSDAPCSCRRIALGFVHDRLGSFSEAERENIRDVIDEIPEDQISNFESVYLSDIKGALTLKNVAIEQSSGKVTGTQSAD
ncbi:MAG: hypothetical protein KDB01_19275 [Planctomycetaceae bacterium]|nr:hypothetical protein [Planctomycetaceae bacterium]